MSSGAMTKCGLTQSNYLASLVSSIRYFLNASVLFIKANPSTDSEWDMVASSRANMSNCQSSALASRRDSYSCEQARERPSMIHKA